MHLKSLTLRGFKSFASSTTLRFEPGMTCVVGANGSGKSNIVDAIAWVLGEQGAKSLRGGKMEDVIFAGTPGRPALGRAEVVLTIDNSDGALPIEYSEVSVSRLMFRSGESEYSINGRSCRLLDVQELLSDSGIGREMHVVVGQGQLDAVLTARPEDRRGFVEEAAGVLKHRRRKEKALRKLDAMSVNLTRLTDLTGELRRQLKPLGRQAEVARRAAGIQADLRDARLRLLADDLSGLRVALEAEVRDEEVARGRRTEAERALSTARDRLAGLEVEAVAEAPRLAVASDTWYRLVALEERLRGTVSLAGERRRHLLESVQEELPVGRDPDELEREAADVRRREAALSADLSRSVEALDAVVGRRRLLEASLAEAERGLVAAVRAVADRREGLARLAGQVGALRSRAAAAAAEIGRLTTGLDAARGRAGSASADFDALQREVGSLDAGEVGLDERYEAASAGLETASERVVVLQAEEREVERERSALSARREALAMSLTLRDGAGALLEAGRSQRLAGVLGPVAELLSVEPGCEAAVAAALGVVADAVAVRGPSTAAEALGLLKESQSGRVGLLVGSSPTAIPGDDRDSAPLPDGACWATSVVTGPDAVLPALHRLLAGVAVVGTLEAAAALVQRAPSLRAVTLEGDLLGGDWAVGGSASAPSVLEVQAAAEEATERLAEATRRAERLRFALAAAVDARERAQAEVEAALAGLHESDARMAGVTERLAQLGAAARAAADEARRLERARAEASVARDRDLEGLAALEERLAAAEAAPATESDEPSSAGRDGLAADCSAVRGAEVEALLAVRTAEERARALAGRADALERAAAGERTARERRVRLRSRRAQAATVAGAVADAGTVVLARLRRSLQEAADERESAESARSARDAVLATLRDDVRTLDADLAALTDVVHRDEVARATQRLQVEALEQRAASEFGVGPDALLEEYGPDVPVPAPEDGSPAAPVPYDRASQEKRSAAAERELALLGRVNPLALEEYAALEERATFLSTQLEDLRATRRDLLTVVREVDGRIGELFASAFADTAREFELVFATLFPGGEGRLMLTDPDDPLSSGIEVEARPPGKKVKRLSLLSGGERSLTAIALLVAIFRARPSPFYVLDEVEAALDDVNLGRLLELLEDLRRTSQLIVITHQKRTMEIADALYGASMRGDGVTTVISQRLREPQTVS